MEKNKWLPESKNARLGEIFLLILVLWMFVVAPLAPQIFGFTKGDIYGPIVTGFTFLFLILGLVFAIWAIFKEKEKTILLIIAFVVLCLITLMIMAFIIGEFTFPH